MSAKMNEMDLKKISHTKTESYRILIKFDSIIKKYYCKDNKLIYDFHNKQNKFICRIFVRFWYKSMSIYIYIYF